MHRHIIAIVALVLAFCSACTSLAAPQQLTPEQQQILESVRTAAVHYSQKLPDFICTQITHRQVSSLSSSDFNTGISTNPRATSMPSMRGPVSSSNVIEERLTYFQQTEKYEVVKLDGKKVAGMDHMDFQGAISAGEFGSSLREIFAPEAHTDFAWETPKKLQGRPVYVFGFRVPSDSGITVVHRETDQVILVGYSGRLYVDIDSLQVRQIDSTLELPAGFPVRMCQRQVEYGPVTIAGRSYTLPLRSEVRMKDAVSVCQPHRLPRLPEIRRGVHHPLRRRAAIEAEGPNSINDSSTFSREAVILRRSRRICISVMLTDSVEMTRPVQNLKNPTSTSRSPATVLDSRPPNMSDISY